MEHAHVGMPNMFAASLCNMFLSLNTLFYLLYLDILNDLSEKPAGTGSSPDTRGLPVTIPICSHQARTTCS